MKKDDIEILYKKSINTIYKFALDNHEATKMEVEDLVCIYNIEFLLAYKTFNADKFTCTFNTFLYVFLKHITLNIIKSNCRLKRVKCEKEFYVDTHLMPLQEYTVEDQFLIFDSFVNNTNPVIRAIAGIISSYKLPNRALMAWLRKTLISFGFTRREINKGFQELKNLY